MLRNGATLQISTPTSARTSTSDANQVPTRKLAKMPEERCSTCRLLRQAPTNKQMSAACTHAGPLEQQPALAAQPATQQPPGARHAQLHEASKALQSRAVGCYLGQAQRPVSFGCTARMRGAAPAPLTTTNQCIKPSATRLSGAAPACAVPILDIRRAATARCRLTLGVAREPQVSGAGRRSL